MYGNRPVGRASVRRLFAVATAIAVLGSTGCAWIVRSSGPESNSSEDSSDAVVSGNGRWVAFRSAGADLLPVGQDTNGQTDVFVFDRQTSTTTRISVATAGTQADLGSSHPAISPDGRFVAFESQATNLVGVGGDTNGQTDVYQRDRDTDADGVYDEAGAVLTRRISIPSVGGEPNGGSGAASISNDGGRVAFRSLATNMVAGDTNGSADVFVRSNVIGATARVSVATGGAQGNFGGDDPSISGDGLTVAFDSFSGFDGTVDGTGGVFARNLATSVTRVVSASSAGAIGSLGGRLPSVSANGRFVGFESTSTNLIAAGSDTNNQYDVFLRDRDSDSDGIFDEAGAVTTTRESVTSTGAQITGGGLTPGQRNVEISPDGRYLVYDSPAGTILPVGQDTNGDFDVFVRDRQLATTARVSVATDGTQGTGTAYAQYPDVSDDGDIVVFNSNFSNLVPLDTNGKIDVFARQRSQSTTTRMSVGYSLPDTSSSQPSISRDGRFVVFSSSSTRLVLGDTNGVADVFVRDNLTGATTRVSVDAGGGQGNLASSSPVISADGTTVAFATATPFTAEDGNAFSDIYVKTLATGAIVRASQAPGQDSNGASVAPAINGDGTVVAFASRARSILPGCPFVCLPFGANVVLVTDLPTEAVEAASVTDGGTVGAGEEPSLDTSGNLVAFSSTASLDQGLWDANAFSDIYVRDRAAGHVIGVTQTPDWQASQASLHAKIGLSPASVPVVAFTSPAANLLPAGLDTNGATDVFAVTDPEIAGSIERVSVTPAGAQIPFGGDSPTLSEDGRFAAFLSPYPGAFIEAWVRDLTTDRSVLASSNFNLVAASNNSFGPLALSANGRYLAFQSEAHNLVPTGENSAFDIYTKAVPYPVVTSVSPASRPAGSTFTLTISGAGFFPDAQVPQVDADYTVSNVVVVNESTITATVTIKATAALTGHSVWVSLIGTASGPASGTTGQCTSCLTVT